MKRKRSKLPTPLNNGPTGSNFEDFDTLGGVFFMENFKWTIM